MLEKSFIIALFVMAIHVIIYWQGMILGFIADWAARIKMKDWLSKPLYACSICMVPYYGTVIYWVFLGNCVKEWVACIFVAMGINGVIVWFKMPSK